MPGTPLDIGAAPSVRLEPPAPDGLHQACEVVLAGLLERRVQGMVVTLKHGSVSVGRVVVSMQTKRHNATAGYAPDAITF